jgi:hypothetical protein
VQALANAVGIARQEAELALRRADGSIESALKVGQGMVSCQCVLLLIITHTHILSHPFIGPFDRVILAIRC